MPFTPAIMIGIRFFQINSGAITPDFMIPTPAFAVPYAAPISVEVMEGGRRGSRGSREISGYRGYRGQI